MGFRAVLFGIRVQAIRRFGAQKLFILSGFRIVVKRWFCFSNLGFRMVCYLLRSLHYCFMGANVFSAACACTAVVFCRPPEMIAALPT